MADPADLITLSRGLSVLPSPLSSGDSTLVPDLITAASKTVRRFLKRNVVATDYDFIAVPINGDQFENQAPIIFLPNYPINSVARIATGRTSALTIVNSDATTNQRATFEVTVSGDPEVSLVTTGLKLVRLASGVSTASTFLWSGYLTVTALATAINALGNGWSAIVASQYALWPSSELYGPAMPIGCISGGPVSSPTLDIFANDASIANINRESGEVAIQPNSFGLTNPLWWPNATPDDASQWGQQVRAWFNAGWPVVPENIQQATGIILQGIYWDNKVAGIYDMERMGDYQYHLATDDGAIPSAARQLLSPYREWRA